MIMVAAILITIVVDDNDDHVCYDCDDYDCRLHQLMMMMTIMMMAMITVSVHA